jgi:hypothetical protein
MVLYVYLEYSKVTLFLYKATVEWMFHSTNTWHPVCTVHAM